MSEIETRRTAMERVLGGSPLGVVVRLLITSLVVGLILRVLDVTPADVFGWVQARIADISNLGLETFREIGGIVLVGAVVVVPIWLALRVLRLILR